jgi:H+/Cl- antiporter ClcA
MTFSLVCAFFAVWLTVFMAPRAMGSGIPELMSILNGVDIPNFISKRILVVKSIGVVLAIAATLCIGKEGPLAHIGACLAVLVLYLPFDWMK